MSLGGANSAGGSADGAGAHAAPAPSGMDATATSAAEQQDNSNRSTARVSPLAVVAGLAFAGMAAAAPTAVLAKPAVTLPFNAASVLTPKSLDLKAMFGAVRDARIENNKVPEPRYDSKAAGNKLDRAKAFAESAMARPNEAGKTSPAMGIAARFGVAAALPAAAAPLAAPIAAAALHGFDSLAASRGGEASVFEMTSAAAPARHDYARQGAPQPPADLIMNSALASMALRSEIKLQVKNEDMLPLLASINLAHKPRRSMQNEGVLLGSGDEYKIAADPQRLAQQFTPTSRGPVYRLPGLGA